MLAVVTSTCAMARVVDGLGLQIPRRGQQRREPPVVRVTADQPGVRGHPVPGQLTHPARGTTPRPVPRDLTPGSPHLVQRRDDRRAAAARRGSCAPRQVRVASPAGLPAAVRRAARAAQQRVQLAHGGGLRASPDVHARAATHSASSASTSVKSRSPCFRRISRWWSDFVFTRSAYCSRPTGPLCRAAPPRSPAPRPARRAGPPGTSRASGRSPVGPRTRPPVISARAGPQRPVRHPHRRAPVHGHVVIVGGDGAAAGTRHRHDDGPAGHVRDLHDGHAGHSPEGHRR